MFKEIKENLKYKDDAIYEEYIWKINQFKNPWKLKIILI